MDNTQNNILTLDMYEDLKEEIIKALKSEVSKSQGGDNAALTQKIEEIAEASAHTAEQVANLTNRIGQIEFQPIINTLPSDNSGIKKLFKYIFGSLKQIGTDVKQNAQGITALQEQVAKMKTEVDTEKFEHLTNHTIYEMQQQIRYLKQPPIVLKIIIACNRCIDCDMYGRILYPGQAGVERHRKILVRTKPTERPAKGQEKVG